MMIRFNWIYLLLFFGIYLVIGYSDNGNYMHVLDEIQYENIKLRRIRRSNPSNTTTVSYPLASSTITSTQTTSSTSQTTSTTTYSTTVTTRTSTVPYNPDTCHNTSYVKLVNDTCVAKFDGQLIAVGILHNNSTNASDTINALGLYISSITNSTTLSNKTNTLSVEEIDNIVNNIIDVNLTLNSNTSFISIQQPHKENNTLVLGAAFNRGIGGQIVNSTNKENITRSFLSTAVIISEESVTDALSLNIMIIDKPTGYENADHLTKKILVSSVVVVNLRRNSSTYNPVLISLYFIPLNEYTQTGPGKYLCSFYNTNNSQWSESGCSSVYYNKPFNRYECNCSHLTSFALIWLPQTSSSTTTIYMKSLNAQDIASLIFEIISIVCFLTIIIHAIRVRFGNPLERIETLKLLPLISTASTTILFIFFIALSLTVYTQTSSSDETDCFLSSSILMFITYFLLIHMFCVKTSAGYFYYLRFVRLFPQPSHRQLFLMLIISFLISLICVILAISFNTKTDYHITQLYPYEICWFTRDVIYYFLTIPIGIFLILNIISIILVSRSILTHAFHAATSEQIHGRMKRCVVILLLSCVTQGIGWLFGPFISFVNPIAGHILAWFFIIFNGLEGFWSIVLYLLIRAQRLDEQKQKFNEMKLSRSAVIPSNRDKRLDNQNEHRINDARLAERERRKDQFYSFNDLRKRETDSPDENDERVFQ